MSPETSASRVYQVWGMAMLSLLSILAAIVLENGWLTVIPLVLAIGWWAIADYKAIFYLLLFTLPFSIQYHFSPSLGTDLPDEPLMIGLALVCLLVIAHRPNAISRSFWRHPLVGILVLQTCWSVVPLIFSTGLVVSLKYLLAKGWYLATFTVIGYWILGGKQQLVTAFRCLVVPLVLVTGLILFRQAREGFSFAEVNRTLGPFFQNHVMYSSMLVCLIPFVLCAYMLNRGHRWRRALMMLVLLFLVVAVALSYSRGAWTALIVGILVYLLVRLKMMAHAVIGFYIFLVGASLWLANNNHYLNFAPDYKKTIYHTDFISHWNATYHMEDLSTEERFYRWIAAVRMSRQRLITGYGPNKFYPDYKDYTVTAFRTYVSDNPEHSTVHNYYLLMLTEQGLPGMCIYATLVFLVFYQGQKTYHTLTDPFYRKVCMAVLVMFGILFTVNFLSDLIETDKIGSLFYLGIALLVNADLRWKHKPE